MRKIIMLSLAAAAIAGAGGVAYAQADPQLGPQGEPQFDQRRPATRVEAEQRSAAVFARMDANHDGKLDPADRAARQQDQQRQAFDRLDADHSGAINFEELSAGREQRGEARAERGGPDGPRFGRRGRGGPDGPRFGRGGPGGPGGPGMARAADTDNDGAISQAEFASAALARFDRIDANNDGTIGADERPQPRRMMRRERRQRDAG